MSENYYDLVSKDNRFFYNPIFARFTDRFNKSFRFLFLVFSLLIFALFVAGVFTYNGNIIVLGIVLVIWFTLNIYKYGGKFSPQTTLNIPVTTCLVIHIYWMISYLFVNAGVLNLGLLTFTITGNSLTISYLLSYIVALILILSFVFSLFSMVADQSMSVFDNISFINREQQEWKKNLYMGLLFACIFLISNFIVFRYFGDWLFPLSIDLLKNIRGIEFILNLVPLIYYIDTLFNSNRNAQTVLS